MATLADHPYIVSVITAGVTARRRPALPGDALLPAARPGRARAVQPDGASWTPSAPASSWPAPSRRRTASGILHRDIKPSNVLVTTYHEPALTDFGIAGHIADVEGESDVRISYPWSPPELLDGRSNGSVASDVYSLGATIWHLLVGRSPFSIPAGDNSTRALSARILHAAAPGHPALRRAAGARPAAAAVPGQEPRAPSAERARARAQPPADRGRGQLAAHRGRGRGRPPRLLGEGDRAGAGGGPHRDEGGHGDLRLRSSPDRDGTDRAGDRGGRPPDLGRRLGRHRRRGRGRAGRRPDPQRRRGRRRPDADLAHELRHALATHRRHAHQAAHAQRRARRAAPWCSAGTARTPWRPATSGSGRRSAATPSSAQQAVRHGSGAPSRCAWRCVRCAASDESPTANECVP